MVIRDPGLASLPTGNSIGTILPQRQELANINIVYFSIWILPTLSCSTSGLFTSWESARHAKIERCSYIPSSTSNRGLDIYKRAWRTLLWAAMASLRASLRRAVRSSLDGMSGCAASLVARLPNRQSALEIS